MFATDDDKNASKNIMVMRATQSLKGKFEAEFADGKKVRIPVQAAVAVQQKLTRCVNQQIKKSFSQIEQSLTKICYVPERRG